MSVLVQARKICHERNKRPNSRAIVSLFNVGQSFHAVMHQIKDAVEKHLHRRGTLDELDSLSITVELDDVTLGHS